jgi:hypothetical protein
LEGAREETGLGGKVRSDHPEMMTEDAATAGAYVDHPERSGRIVRPRSCLLRREIRVRSENSATASGEGNRRDAREATGVNQHGVDYAQLSIGTRVEQGPNHDRIRADLIGRRSRGLHRISNDGRRHLESADRGRQQPLIGSGRKLAAPCFLPDNYKLATRESFYELEDTYCCEDTRSRRPDYDRIRLDPGHHRRRRRFALPHVGNHRSGSHQHDRQFPMSASRLAATMTSDQFYLRQRAGNRFCRRVFRSRRNRDQLGLETWIS